VFAIQINYSRVQQECKNLNKEREQTAKDGK
jgi:hypothetical protein